MSTATTQQPAGENPGAEQPPGDALDELHNALGEDEPTAAGTDPAGEWQPPTREEYEALVKAREAAEGKLKRARTQAQRLREGAKATPATPAAPEGGEAPGPDLAPEVDRWKGAAIRQTAEAALLKRGADPDMVELAIARLRIADIELDADGRPELEDFLDEMEERYPKLFAKGTAPSAQTGARAVGSVNQGGAAQRPAPRQLSLGEQIIANSEAARQRSRR